jgi:hypothetical protein
MVLSVMARLIRQTPAVIAPVKHLKRQYWHKEDVGQAYL